MARTLIQNVSSGVLTLPAPLRGVLGPGAQVVSSKSVNELLAAFNPRGGSPQVRLSDYPPDAEVTPGVDDGPSGVPSFAYVDAQIAAALATLSGSVMRFSAGVVGLASGTVTLYFSCAANTAATSGKILFPVPRAMRLLAMASEADVNGALTATDVTVYKNNVASVFTVQIPGGEIDAQHTFSGALDFAAGDTIALVATNTNAGVSVANIRTTLHLSPIAP